jgi:hypothetical protein
VDRLVSDRLRPLPPDRVDGWLALIRAGRTAEECIQVPIGREWVVGFETVHRRVGLTAAAGSTGRLVEELVDMANNGDLPPLRDPGVPLQEWYWVLDDIIDVIDDGPAVTGDVVEQI